MKTVYKWLLRTIVMIGICVCGLLAWYAYGMSRSVVSESNGFTNVITSTATDSTLSGSLPKTATRIRHCYASVGLAGRLMLYRFDAPIEDLHRHASAEFAAHWDKIKPTKAVNAPAPSHNAAQAKQAFGVTTDWMVPPATAMGTMYTSADVEGPHQPTIFVDETNNTLYFYMID